MYFSLNKIYFAKPTEANPLIKKYVRSGVTESL